MTSIRSRFLAAFLALLLAVSAPLTALADEPLPAPGGEVGDSAELLNITVPDYTPGPGLQAGDVNEVREGGLYTLIVLPAKTAASGSRPRELTAQLLTAADPLFVGSAVAEADGKVTFTGIRLRTAESAVYYVTGPGLTVPLAEATSLSVSVNGSVYRPGNGNVPITDVLVSLVDASTGYSYANTVRTNVSGSFELSNISPGSYLLHMEKPGYLPATRPQLIDLSDGTSKYLPPFDLSPYIGDINGDGQRDISDLTALLSCYGLAVDAIPAGLAPNLNDTDSVVDVFDLTLLLNAMMTQDNFPAGVGAPTSAALSIHDDAPDDQTDRSLVFSLDHGGVKGLTFTAASISLTFRSDYIQPINQNGGAVSPSAASAANCLVPKAGVSISDARWTLNGDLTTLTFSLSCEKPTALTDLVEFRYRPAPGRTTSDFFQGVFSVGHTAVLVGEVTVLTGDQVTLQYPNSAPLALDSLTIDLTDTTLTIPSAGHDLVIPLSATGHLGETNYPNLSGVTWSLSGQTHGVSVSDSLLTISGQARPGWFQLTAQRGELTSTPLIVTLENAPSAPSRILISRDNVSGSDHTLSGAAGEPLSFPYTAQVIDQYNDAIPGETVLWSLSGAPDGVTVGADGILTVSPDLPAGTYTFSLLASLNSLRSAVNITLTLEPSLAQLMLSGPSAAQIPSGAGTLTLTYLLSAIDSQGRVIPVPSLNPSFSLVWEGDAPPAGITTNVDMSGSLTVTLDRFAQSGEYTLHVAEGDISTDFTLTLLPAQEENTVPVQVGFTNADKTVNALSFLFLFNDAYDHNTDLHPQLLSADGIPVVDLFGQSWRWSVSDGYPYYTIGTNSIQLSHTGVPAGEYFFTVTAFEEVSGLSASIPVQVTVLPDLDVPELSVPDSLTVPISGSLGYTLGYTLRDKAGNAVAPSCAMKWSVTGPDGKTAPTGVSISAAGELTVTSAAQAGEITVSLQCETPKEYLGDPTVLAQASASVTLVPAATDKVLALRRDGELLSGGVDATYGKEGTSITLRYTPVLLDRATGQVEELTEGVSWMGSAGVFTVDNKAEPGTYTAPITAVYKNQSVSLSAQITVYPDITTLYIRFDEGNAITDVANRYSFPVPSQAPKTYHGTVMAQIKRGEKTAQVPLSQLGLSDYDIDIYTPLTGVYTAYDRATGRLALTIEPLASSNSMKDPGENDPELRYMAINFSYYPGQKPFALRQTFLLTKETSSVTNAVLRQGTGSGAKFVFETTRGDVSLSAASGVVSHCYALELLDQYGNAVVDKQVTWTLSGSPSNGSANYISLVDPGDAVTDNYPRYQSIRRLRVAPDTPAGSYDLTLTASAAGFTRTQTIHITVTGRQTLDSLTVTGPEMTIIPIWYAQYNSSATNNKTTDLSYAAAALDPYGNEFDSTLCDFTWTVATADGKAPAGVTIQPDKSNRTLATVTLDRYAQPAAEDDRLRITVTATPKDSGETTETTFLLELARSSRVPTLMRISGPTSYKLELDGSSVTNDYTFKLVDQYNQDVSKQIAKTVTWSIKNKPSYVSMSSITKDDLPAVRITVRSQSKDVRATFSLTASVTFSESTTSSGKATVFQTLSIPVTIGNPPIGGGGTGGEVLEETVTTSTVTPSTSKSGTTGTVTLSKEEVETLTKTTALGTLTIAPKNTSGLTSVTVTLPGSMLKAIRDKTQNQSLRIQTSIGTVTIPKSALASFPASGNTTVTIRNQDNTLEVTFRGNGSEIKTFSSGTVTLTAPVKGDTVTAVQGGVSSDVLTKTVISGGTLTVTLTGSAQLTVGYKPQGKVFSDTRDHWAREAVEFVTARNLFQGTSETTFDPNGNMTRSMVVTVLHRLENTPAPTTSNIFRDVPAGTWYTDAVVWANAHGIVQGNGDGFLPNDPVTREQLATILYRYMQQSGHDTSKRSALSSFSDSGSVSSWAQEAMEWAVATGLITGKGGGVLDPGGNASRAEVATMLERLLRNLTPSV